jgi:hypothetical protein
MKILVAAICLVSVVSFAKNTIKAEGWYGQNAVQLQKLIDEKGRTSPIYDAKKKPIAVFDWDNTVIKNDIGDGTMFWMVTHDLIKKPKSWRETSLYLTDEAVAELEKNCGSLPNPLTTKSNENCADTILSIYTDGKLPNGHDAWNGKHNPETMEPGYAWTVQLTAGYKPSEMKKIAEKAIKFNLSNPVGAKQKIGSKEYPAYIRIYPQVQDLINILQKTGFDVWITSASLEYIVVPFAKMVGIPEKRVIGVRPALDKNNQITTLFQKCNNPEDDGTFINFRFGKRCWINKVIFGQTDVNKLGEANSIDFSAGDSDNDLPFVQNARSLRLVINRNKNELMCHAFANQDGRWLVNPMFIEPKPQKTAGYSCGKFGLADQKDLVF